VDASRFKQPKGVKLASASSSDLVAQGEKLWNDRTLGKSGLACANCHIGNYLQMQPSFAQPYPHYVAMPAQQGGVDEVSAAEMVQFCMIVPMADEPLPWDSLELASLAAWVEHIRPDYAPVAGAPATQGANPCNPCAGANPCNPGSLKRNPCNPCSGDR
jgi:cytochrome c